MTIARSHFYYFDRPLYFHFLKIKVCLVTLVSTRHIFINIFRAKLGLY